MIDIKLEKCMVKPLMNLLKFFPDWFVASKIIKKLLTALYADDNILHFNEDSANALFLCNTVGNFFYLQLLEELTKHLHHRQCKDLQFCSSNCFVLQLKDLYQILFPFYIQKALCYARKQHIMT